jgi:S-(hydroxymethyl)glutathione dehydrogenase/alcohol dehydrogenase
MLAAVCYAFGQPLVVEHVDLDPPGPGEVKVRLAAVGVCHSDLNLVRGHWQGWSSPVPVVAGHEGAGVVAETGPGVLGLRPGDRVVVSLMRWCGRCFFCAQGAPHLCEARFALASEKRLRNRLGQPLNQGISTGAFAEYAVVDQSQVIPIPPELPLDRACLLACGVITGVGAVLNTARVPAGSSVVVVGAGGVGLNVVQGARLAGAHPLIAVDVLEHKLAAAREFGATHALDARDPDLRGAVRALTAGRGADYVFVAAASAAAAAAALRLARRGGAIVLVGMPNSADTAPLDVADFVWRGQSVIGSNVGSTRPSLDVPRLAAWYLRGELRLDELITARYPLADINLALEALERGDALRGVLILAPDLIYAGDPA